MALTFFWRCEGTTLDATHDFSANDTTATANGSPAISSTAAKIGTNGVLIDDIESYEFSSTSIVSAAVGTMASWIRVTSWTGGKTLFAADNAAEANDRIMVALSGTDEISFNVRRQFGSNVTLTTSAANLATNTWYFVKVAWDEPNNDRRLAVYDSSLSLIEAVQDLATNYDQPTTITRFYIGDPGASPSGTFHADNFFVGSAYNELFEDKANITSYTEYAGGGGGLGASKLLLQGVGR